MKVRDLLATLNELTIGDLEKEVYVDVEGDEYVELEFVPIAETIGGETIGFVICELKDIADDGEPKQLSVAFEKEEVH